MTRPASLELLALAEIPHRVHREGHAERSGERGDDAAREARVRQGFERGDRGYGEQGK